MRIEELAFVCQEAARDLVARETRPLPPVVIVPGQPATRVLRLPDLPDDDAGRLAVITAVANDALLPTNAPAYGFVAEADVGGTDAVIVVYGAHSHPARIAAAELSDAGLGDFTEPEDLDPMALPFLHPLQHAVDHSS